MATREVTLTKAARDVLDQAQVESRRLQHEYIGTEHVALALLRITEGPTAAVWRGLSIDTKGLGDAIDSFVAQGKAPSPDGKLPLTSRTKRALDLSADAARESNNIESAPEHLLLGLLRESKGVGGQMLSTHGVTVAAVQRVLAG